MSALIPSLSCRAHGLSDAAERVPTLPPTRLVSFPTTPCLAPCNFVVLVSRAGPLHLSVCSSRAGTWSVCPLQDRALPRTQ